MAIIDARMQHKRGLKVALDKSKLLPGEFAVPTDGETIFVCIAAGVVLEIPSLQSLQEILNTMNNVIEQGNHIIAEFQKLEIEKVGINDNQTSTVTTYSSSKILQLIDTKIDAINSNLDNINSKKLVGFTEVTLDDISNDANNLAVGQTVSFGVSDGKALLNTPFQTGGRIYCIYALGNRPLQIAFVYTSGKMYIRSYYSSWSVWNGVAFDS